MARCLAYDQVTLTHFVGAASFACMPVPEIRLESAGHLELQSKMENPMKQHEATLVRVFGGVMNVRNMFLKVK